MVETPHGIDFSFSFRAQVAEERRLGLTPALHMDAKDERVQCQLEINFIDCVVTPLWEHMAHCFPALQPCMERLRANRAAYAALAQCSAQEVAQVPYYCFVCFAPAALHGLSDGQQGCLCCSCTMQCSRSSTGAVLFPAPSSLLLLSVSETSVYGFL